MVWSEPNESQRQKRHLGPQHGGRGQTVGPSSAALPDALAGSWTRSRAARAQTGTHLGCPHCKRENRYSLGCPHCQRENTSLTGLLDIHSHVTISVSQQTTLPLPVLCFCSACSTPASASTELASFTTDWLCLF